MTRNFRTYRNRRILKLQARVGTNGRLLEVCNPLVGKFLVHDGTGEAKGNPVWSLRQR
jgi:hypothetical protein